jgi:hypothetical protein
MSAPHVVINDLFGEAPARRVLRGDKKKQAEPGTHIIEFPGGAVELARLDDGTYWVHIIVNRGQALSDLAGMDSALGSVVESRIDWHERKEASIPSLPSGSSLTQLAVRIRPEFPS